MKNSGLIAFCIAMLLLQGCSDDSGQANVAGEPQLASIAGEVGFAELGRLPRDATINVDLIAVDDDGQPGMVIASSQTGARSASPYAFNLLYDADLIQEDRQYRVYATVRLEGEVVDDTAGSVDPFATDTIALRFRGQSELNLAGGKLVTLSLQDLNWRLISIGETLLAAEMAEARPDILVDGKGAIFKGFGGCNHYSGGYVLDGTSLMFENITSTRKACDTGMELEVEYLEMLSDVATWRMDGQNMVLGDSERNELARFEVSVDAQ